MNIRHSPACELFLADVEDRLAILQYETREQRLVIRHTFVPPQGRGRGLAEALVRAAVEHAANQGLAVVYECPFAAAIAQRRGWTATPVEHPSGPAEDRRYA